MNPYRLYDVLSQEPENGNATLALGLVYYGLNNLTMAEETFLRTLEIKPDNPKVLYNIGIVQQTMEKYPDAIKHLSWLLELNPENIKAANILGICYKSMNKQQKARELFEYALERDPKFGPALINLGKSCGSCVLDIVYSVMWLSHIWLLCSECKLQDLSLTLASRYALVYLNYC